MRGRSLAGVIVVLFVLSILPGPAEAALGPADLSSWSKQGVTSKGTWIVAGDGLSVVQTQNGDGNLLGPTFFVGDQPYALGQTLQGSVVVETTSDDDHVGFVFSYQSPLASEGHASDAYEFCAVDWKEGAQTYGGHHAPEGFRLFCVEGTVPAGLDNDAACFWGLDAAPCLAETGATVTVLATDTGSTRGWADNVKYTFKIEVSANEVSVVVDGGAFSNEVVFDQVAGTFTPGHFGFYSSSQMSTRYEFLADPDEPPIVVPELATLGLVAMGLVAVGWVGFATRRRR